MFLSALSVAVPEENRPWGNNNSDHGHLWSSLVQLNFNGAVDTTLAIVGQ
jgi:hypothetical protein